MQPDPGDFITKVIIVKLLQGFQPIAAQLSNESCGAIG